jgi:mono/diheme cytochrome c family protein
MNLHGHRRMTARSGAMLLVVFGLAAGLPRGAAAQGEPYRGADLYRMNCAGCHGLDRRGNPPTYPSLLNIREKLSRSRIRDQIRNGKGLMPPFTHLSDGEVAALVAFLYGEASAAVAEAPTAGAEWGRLLFQSNCRACHQMTIHDPAPTGIPAEHPMIPAPLAGATKRFTKNQFFTILETGPGFMPSFRHLNEAEWDALWQFAATLEGKGEPRHPTMLERHPRMIGRGGMMGMMRRMGSAERRRPITEEEITRAIRQSIDNGARLNNGYYLVPDRPTGALLRLKLTRIHQDKLSRVDADRYFACVDMEASDGNTFDIDFFLQEREGELVIQETTVHKVNGVPRYHWVYRDGRWQKETP